MASPGGSPASLHPETLALFDAASAYFLEGVSSDLIHPETAREDAFAQGAIMPSRELYPIDQAKVVLAGVVSSLGHIINDDTLVDPHRRVSTVLPYAMLLEDGRQLAGQLPRVSSHKGLAKPEYVALGLFMQFHARLSNEQIDNIGRVLIDIADAQKASDKTHHVHGLWAGIMSRRRRRQR